MAVVAQLRLDGVDLMQQLIHLVQQILVVARRSSFSVQRAGWMWRHRKDLRWRGAEEARVEALVEEVGDVWKGQWLVRRLELRGRKGDGLGRIRRCGCGCRRGRGGVAC